jgi:hypothetical protein
MHDEEFAMDPVTGRKAKRDVMSKLNQRRVSKWELDELFAEEEA